MKNNQSNSLREDPDPLPLTELLPKIRGNNDFYQNGYVKIIDKILVKVYSQIEDCYKVWEKFSPKESLFDLWEFRYCWYMGYQHKPYFYSLIYKNQVLGFIPLWYDPIKKRYEWFGSDWMEDNKFFVIDEKFIPLLIKILPKPYYLNAILPKYNNLDFFASDEAKYIYFLDKIKSFDQFLFQLDKKNRHHLKRDYLKILQLDPKIIIDEDSKIDNLLLLKKLSQQRFDGFYRDWSDFIILQRFNVYKRIISQDGVFKSKFIKVFIQNKLAAIDLIITYKDRYYPLKGANDVERFDGIGNFMNYLEFKNAIDEGYKIIDCLQGNYNWKNKYYKSLNLLKIKSI